MKPAVQKSSETETHIFASYVAEAVPLLPAADAETRKRYLQIFTERDRAAARKSAPLPQANTEVFTVTGLAVARVDHSGTISNSATTDATFDG